MNRRVTLTDDVDFAAKTHLIYFNDGFGRACRIALLAIVFGSGGRQ
jgi:hypothetical protein